MQRTFKSTTVACYIGYFVQAIINNLSPILFIVYRSEFQISLGAIGNLILVNFLSQTAVDILSVKIVDRVGYKRIILASHAFATAGLILLGILPQIMDKPSWGLVIATVLSAIGSGMIEVTISPIIDSIPSDKKEADMSLLHSFYCWGQMLVVALSTLFIHFAGDRYWFVLPFLWALVPLCNLINFSTVPFMPTLKEEEKIPLRKLLPDKPFIIAMVLMLCAGASELAMSQWSSYFAEAGLGVSKFMGDLLGPCLFAVFMGCGRLLFGIFGQKINLRKAMFFCAALCIICYSVTAFSPSPLLSLFGCALTGFSISLFWPGTFSMFSAMYPNGGAAMFGVLAILGDIGCSVGPWLVSTISTAAQNTNPAISDGGALKAGLAFGNLFPVLIILSLLLLPLCKKKAVDTKEKPAYNNSTN